MDLWVNLTSLLVQGLLVGPLMRRAGLAAVLVILPVVTAGGSVWVRLDPTLTVLVAFQVLRRACDYGVAKPAREVLFTLVDRADKYKAKAFIDTFVYRTGDALGALAFGGAQVVAPVAVGGALAACVAWGATSVALGRGYTGAR
jgi:AAA family ATP:ADP antiporter